LDSTSNEAQQALGAGAFGMSILGVFFGVIGAIGATILILPLSVVYYKEGNTSRMTLMSSLVGLVGLAVTLVVVGSWLID
ncbi:MAG: hypothetical protein WAS36_03780, partial [Candidatus Saccharimonadales bacterium]